MESHQTDREGCRDPHGPRASPQDNRGEEPARAPEEETLNSGHSCIRWEIVIQFRPEKGMVPQITDEVTDGDRGCPISINA